MARFGRLRPGPRAATLIGALARWARTSGHAKATRRRFVVIQVCGLSHDLLQAALARRWMPGSARLVRRGSLRVHRTCAALPSSTPAFQAGVMYGGPVDIPGFEFFDKRTGEYLWFPLPWAAAKVE